MYESLPLPYKKLTGTHGVKLAGVYSVSLSDFSTKTFLVGSSILVRNLVRTEDQSRPHLPLTALRQL